MFDEPVGHFSYQAGVATCVSAGNSTDLHGRVTHAANLKCTHRRLLLTPPTTYVNKFPSTRVLVQAMRDVIRAHELLLEYGIPYPGNNIKPGTVMIGSNLRGYLFDFDHCTHIPAGEDSREEINTPYPRDKYPGSPGTGTSRDLESLFWLYIWVIYRHVKYDVKAGYIFNANLYDFSSDDSGAYTEGLFLRKVEIPDFDKNKPLTQLTVDLQQIFRSHLLTKDEGDHGPPLDTTSADSGKV